MNTATTTMTSSSSSSYSSVPVGGGVTILGDDILKGIRDFLSPKDGYHLSMCNQRLHRILPMPLGIQIHHTSNRVVNRRNNLSNSNTNNIISHDILSSGWLFVSPRSNQQKMLTCRDTLRYGEEYYLWKYDRHRCDRVYLGRHLRQTNRGGGRPTQPAHYRFTLGFQPAEKVNDENQTRQRLQHWKVRPVSSSSSSMTATTDDDDTVVTWGQSVQLVVCGDGSRLGQPESIEEHVLGTMPSTAPTYLFGPTALRNRRSPHPSRNFVALHPPEQEQDNGNNNDENDDWVNAITARDVLNGRLVNNEIFNTRTSTTDVSIWNPSSLMAKRSNNDTTTGDANTATINSATATTTTTTAGTTTTIPSHAEPTTTIRRLYHEQSIPTYEIHEVNDKGAYILYSPEQWEKERYYFLLEDGAENSEDYVDNDGNSNNSNGARGNSRNAGTPVVGRENTDTTISTTASTTTTQATELSSAISHSDDGRCAIIEFHFWATNGYLYFRSLLLPFALGIPVMKLDRSFFQTNLGHMANLYESYSARWGCIKYYMATAADVGEGCLLDMDAFIQGVTDHEDHRVIVQNEQQLICIDMQDEVDTEIADIPRDEGQVWRFCFSW